MTREEFIQAVAELVAGLQVPVSLPGGRAHLGAGYEPWERLIHAVVPFGWTNPTELSAHYTKIMNGEEATT